MRLHSFALLTLAAAAGLTACADRTSAPSATTPARHDATTSLTLATCPNGTTLLGPIQVVGLLGGILSFDGNTVTIPPYAVTSPTAFQIVIPQSQYMEVDVHAVGLTSYLFQQPVNVTIDYSRCPAGAIPSGATLHAAYIDSFGNVLQDMGGTADTVAKKLTFSTGHFSGYAVAY